MKKWFMIFFLLLILVFSMLFAKRKPKKKPMYLEVPERSAESANSYDEYKRTKIYNREPKPTIVIGGYFIEPKYIKPPDIIKNDDHRKEKDADKLKGLTDISEKLSQVAERYFKIRKRYAVINGYKVRIVTDCAHFVRSIYWKVLKKDLFQEAYNLGIRTNSGCGLLIGLMKKNRYVPKKYLPKPGDVIFFNNTYDRNRNRRFDDPLTHVGIVTEVDRNDRIVHYIHANVGRPKQIKKAFQSMKYPHTFRHDRKQVNSYLQARYRWDRRKRKSTSAELTRCYGGF